MQSRGGYLLDQFFDLIAEHLAIVKVHFIMGVAFSSSSVIFKENISFTNWLHHRDQLQQAQRAVGVAGATGSQHTSPTKFVGLFI